VLNKARKNPEGDEADIIYKTMDKDENGQLSAKEIIEAIKKKHSDWPVTEITETVKRFDVNNDGKISREEFAAALGAMQDRPGAKARVKPGQKPLSRAWTFQNPKPVIEKEESAPLVGSPRVSLTAEDLKKAEQLLLDQRAQKDRDAAAKKVGDEKAAAEAKAAADAASAEDEAKAAANKAKVNAKIAEVEANMEKKKQDAAANADAEAKATAEAEAAAAEAAAAKQGKRAKLADDWIAAEKEKKKPEQDAKKAAAAAATAEEEAAEKERLAKIAAQTDAAATEVEQQEQKDAEAAAAAKRSVELRGGV